MDTNIMTVLALGSDVLHDVMCNDNVSIRFTISTSESFTRSLLKIREYMYLASHFSFAAVNADIPNRFLKFREYLASQFSFNGDLTVAN